MTGACAKTRLCGPLRAPPTRRCSAPIVPRERMILSRIAVDRDVRFVGKRSLDVGLRRLGDKLVFFSQMH